MNFSLQVSQYKKYQYQEGKENDCIFVCSDGTVCGGSITISFASLFLEMAIAKEKNKQTFENYGKTVELDFKLFPCKTVKVNLFRKLQKTETLCNHLGLDLVYGVNVDPIAPKLGLQIIQFVSKLGHYKLPEGKDDFECTTRMIDTIAENIKDAVF